MDEGLDPTFGAPPVETGVKAVVHTANAWEGMSKRDQEAMKNLENMKGRLRPWLNESIRRRQFVEPAPAVLPRATEAPVTRYLCGLCQAEMFPGVAHRCAGRTEEIAVDPIRPIVEGKDNANPFRA